jgi:hypothetical protein
MVKVARKRSTKPNAAYARHVLQEARLGNMAPLAGHVRFCAGRHFLTREQSEFIAELLERGEGKRGKAALQRVEKELIRQQVQGFIDEEGLKLKAAITEVMKSRGIRSAETIYAALRDSKKRK